MSSHEMGWTKVSYKKEFPKQSNKKEARRRGVGRYIPPSMKKVDYTLVPKKPSSLKSKSEKIINDYNNNINYEHKYLKTGIYFDEDYVDLIDSGLLSPNNTGHKDKSIKYIRSIKALKEFNNNFNVQNISEIINNINLIEVILEDIIRDLPYSRWMDKIYKGLIYNSNGLALNEETDELKKMSKDYITGLKNKPVNPQKNIIKKSSKSTIYKKIDKNLSFRDLLIK